MCPDLTAPENGAVMYNGRRTGDTAEYSCNVGYELVGDQTSVCMSNSQWSGQTPSVSLVLVMNYIYMHTCWRLLSN